MQALLQSFWPSAQYVQPSVEQTPEDGWHFPSQGIKSGGHAGEALSNGWQVPAPACSEKRRQ
jgi:hypothetical protein